jgi:hypothetical protein
VSSVSLTVVDVLLAVAAFIGGLLAKPLADLSTELVRQIVARRQAKTDKAVAQADLASERCWEALAILASGLPRHLPRKRRFMSGANMDYPQREEVEERLLGARVLLEANSELLGPEARAPMRRVVDILGAVEDIEPGTNAPFAHYDSATTIVNETARYGRQILGAQLRGEKVPAMPDRLREYLIAKNESDEFWDEDYPQSQGIPGVKTARELWLGEHRAQLDKIRSTDD